MSDMQRRLSHQRASRGPLQDSVSRNLSLHTAEDVGRRGSGRRHGRRDRGPSGLEGKG